MVRKESSMLRPALLDPPMKNGAVFHQPPETPDRLLLRSVGRAINQASTLKELFSLLMEALNGVWPFHVASLALQTADGKFVHTPFIACQSRIFTTTAIMPYRRFDRLLKRQNGQDYLDYLPVRLSPLLFPASMHQTATNGLSNFETNHLGENFSSATAEHHQDNGAASGPLVEAETYLPEAAIAANFSSILLAPLRRHAAEKTICGCFMLASPLAKVFSKNDGELLAALAGLLVAGIEKVQLQQEKENERKRFQYFAEASLKMSRATDWNTALQEIAQAAALILPVPLVSATIIEYEALSDWSRAPISAIEGNGAVAGPAAKQAITEDERAGLSSFPLRQTRGLVNRLLQNRPILVADIQKSRLFSEAAKERMAKHGMEAYYGAPIVLRLEANALPSPFALLSFYLRSPREFDQIATNWLQVLTAQAAQVLENIRRYQQVHRNQTTAENLMRNSMEALEDFVYVISHNLKAPIVSIQGFSEILDEEVGPMLAPEQRHFLDRLRKNAALMEKMILDLLEFSRLGHTPVKFEPINLKDLAQSVVDEIRLLGQAPETEFILPRPIRLYADVAELKTVFENLLSNAVKYRRPESPLCVEIGWEELPRFHVLWVRDNGIGMEPCFQAKAFDLFQRGPDVGQIPGTGVGLAIVRRIVENHQGVVRLDSKLGEGTTIYFTLPKIPSTEVASNA